MPQPTYGERWRAFRAWYFAHPRTLKRCAWCLVKPHPVRALQLNHLTYRMPDPDWPAWWQVAPMCKRCHDWETWLTRRLFGTGWQRVGRPNAHYYVTLGVPAAGWLTALLCLLLATWTVA